MLTQSASLPSADPSPEAAQQCVLARAVQIVPNGLPEIQGSRVCLKATRRRGELQSGVEALPARRRVPAENAGYQQQLLPPRVSRAGTCALRSPVCTQFSSVYPLFHVVAAARSALGWYSPTHCRCSGDLDSRVCDGGVIFRKLSEGQGGRRREPRAARVYQGKSPKPPQRN